jgi:hypothetical protein
LLCADLLALLAAYNFEDHLNNLIYLAHLYFENVASDYLFEEELQIHAYNNIKQLIKLIEVKEKSETKNLSITVKNKINKDLTVTFDSPISMKHAWEDLYNAFLKSLTKWSGNHIIRQKLDNIELTIENLKLVQMELRPRKNSFWNKSLASFSNTLIYYMKEYGAFPKESSLSSENARLIYDILAVLKLINDDSLGSQKDDYIRSLLKNNNRNS